MNETKSKKSSKKASSTNDLDETSKPEQDANDTAELEKPETKATVSKPTIEENIDDIPQTKKLKIKVIRDNFSFPEEDYSKIFELKKQCLAAGVHVKKSELLRAGLTMLSKLSLEELVETVEKIEKLQTGRPKASKKTKA